MLPIAAAMLALTGALALACFVKAFGLSFLALPRSPHARKAQEVPAPMRFGMGILASLCLFLGLGPTVVVPLLDRVSESFVGISIAGQMFEMGGWTLAPVSGEFSSLSTPVLAIVLVGLTGLGLGLAYVLGGKGKKRFYKTWGCGLNLTARMEYTTTGFVQPIKRVFSTIYQPTVKLETEFLEESHYFAKRRHFEFSIEPIFLKYLYHPIVNFFSTLADRSRVIQAGSLSTYLAYIFVTLVLLLVIMG